MMLQLFIICNIFIIFI